MTSFADLKREARAAVHAAFAVSALYHDPLLASPAALTVRVHAKGVQSVGDIENDGFAEMLVRPDRIVFLRDELVAAGVQLRRNGRVQLSDYGDAMFVLDAEEPVDGPTTVVWTVVRPTAGEAGYA